MRDMMTKITKVRCCALRIPLEVATAFSQRAVTERHYAIVEIEGDDGHKGIGFCYAGSAGGKLVSLAVRELFAAKLIGQDAHRVEGLWQEMYQEALLQGRAGAVMRALSIIDIALWDRNARAADLPLYKFLGAVRTDRVPAYEDYDPYWIEEPFSPDDIDNHARLAASTPVPVATGEIEVGRWRFKELLDKEAAAILQADAAVCGGISEFRRIAATAASYGVTLCPHWFHDLHAHLVASTPNARYVELFPDDKVLNFRRLVDRQLVFTDGDIVLPQEPGLGFGFDPAAVKKYALEPWG